MDDSRRQELIRGMCAQLGYDVSVETNNKKIGTVLVERNVKGSSDALKAFGNYSRTHVVYGRRK